MFKDSMKQTFKSRTGFLKLHSQTEQLSGHSEKRFFQNYQGQFQEKYQGHNQRQGLTQIEG